MLHGSGMIHKRGEGIGNSRMSGVTGLGGQTEVGQAQTGCDDIIERHSGALPNLLLRTNMKI